MRVRTFGVLLVAAAVLLAGCMSARERPRTDEAIEDFISAAELEELDKIRTRGDYNIRYLTDRFVIVETRDEEALVRFTSLCREIDQLPVRADIRYDDKALRARFDTIRSCRIAKLYALHPGQAAELEYIADPPDTAPK